MVVGILFGNAFGLMLGFFIYKSGFGNLIAMPMIIVGMIAWFGFLVAKKLP